MHITAIIFHQHKDTDQVPEKLCNASPSRLLLSLSPSPQRSSPSPGKGIESDLNPSQELESYNSVLDLLHMNLSVTLALQIHVINLSQLSEVPSRSLSSCDTCTNALN